MSIRSAPQKQDCICGQYYGVDKSDADGAKEAGERNSLGIERSTISSPNNGATAMDASFVHLPPSLLVREEEAPAHVAKRSYKETHASSEFLERYNHIKHLEQAANSPLHPPRLCVECVQRVEQALNADTERLENECRLYQEAMRDEDARLEGMKRALKIAASSMPQEGSDDNSESTDDGWKRAEQAFRDEIQMLTEACQQHEEELSHLQSLRREQAAIAKELDEFEYTAEEERNSLELEARAFDNVQEQLYRTLAEVEAEVERLSSTRISLPSMLFDLQVDKERGLRYPLINELRLAYRPKGDIQWEEIQAAWSSANQLLLVIGTLFQFQSQNFKIVPLSHCSKLIYYRDFVDEKGTKRKSGATVYNLGHGKTKGSKALVTWSALLHQMIQHAMKQLSEACEDGLLDAAAVPPLPFDTTSTSIGGVALSRLDDNDDAGWSRAIHFMASDLLWLSECASVYVRQRVILSSS